jgi:hypothetical protein
MLIYVVLLSFEPFRIMGGLLFHMLTDLLIAYLCILVAENVLQVHQPSNS